MIYIYFFPFSLFVSVYLYASVCNFVYIALLLPYVLGFCLSVFFFVYFVGVFLIQFLALVVIGGFVFWFSCSLLSFFLNYLKIFFNNYFLF